MPDPDLLTRSTAPGPARRRIETAVLALVVGLPILVLIVVLARRTWYPTGDLAQAELRMRSLPRHPPLVGAAGRITDAEGRQGNHPGPLMFWVTWPFYVVLGRSAWAFEAATAIVNLAWLATATWLVRRRSSVAVTLWFVAVTLVLLGGFGLDGLTQPWNPWVALLPFAVLVLTAWRALDGWRWAPVLAVAAGSYAIQGHAGYAPVALPLVAVATLAPLWSWWRNRPARRRSQTVQQRKDLEAVGAAAAVGVDLGVDDRIIRTDVDRPVTDVDNEPDDHATEAGRSSHTPAPLFAGIGLAALVGLAAWSGPFWDAATSHPSNVHKLLDNFGSPTEPPIGMVDGIKTVLRAFAPLGPWVHGGILPSGSVLPGLLLLIAWAAVAAAVMGGRREHRALVQLDAVLALALLLAVIAVSRIFGVPFLYVYRWITILVALVVFTLGWGIALLLPRPAGVWPTTGRTVLGAALAGVVLFGTFTSVRVGRQGIPYPYSWRMEQVLAPATAAQLDHGTRYLVDWQDQVYLGGLGFGLILDLERRGFTVGARPRDEAAVEPHRVFCPGSYGAVLTVVTGPVAIDAWKAKPGTKLLARVGSVPGFDYDRTFDRLRRVLAAKGVDRTPAQLEQQITGVLFGAGNTPETSRLVSALISNGVPSAVFLQQPAPAEPPLSNSPVNAPCRK